MPNCHSELRFDIRHFSSGQRRWVILLIGLLLLWIGAPVGQAAPPSQGPDNQQTTKPERIPTDDWAVQLSAGVNPNAVAARYGFVNLGQVGTLPNVYLFRRPPGQAGQADPDRLRAAPEVVWLQRQFARQQYPRVIPTDPLSANQWHLNNTGQSGGTPGQDINVIPVWNNNIMGTGVQIAVVDDGLQHTHPDLSPNYVAGDSFDFNNNDADPSPSVSSNFHGTAVAGVAAARDNTTCGTGSAFRANVTGLRLIAGPSTDAMEASALTYHYGSNDIFNNSWGPNDDGKTLEGPGPLTLAALQDGATNGRGGLGSIYVWAAGNGKASKDNINYDGYANSRFTIAVGAVDHNGVQSSYSEPGAPMLVTAPSSGAGVSVTTTDLLGANGYSSNNCTSTFGGTSSASPLAAGVVALILEANPNLTLRDVQHILVETAVKNHPADSGWSVNGAGHHINHKYGFGRVDATAAVAAASTWTNVNPATEVGSGVITVNQTIPDNNSTGLTSSFIVNNNISLEHVEVVFNATHSFRGNLEVILTSPSGTQSILAEQHNDSGDHYNNWQFMSVRNWGESSQGTWTLKVADKKAANVGTFNSWQLKLHGTPTDASTANLTISKADAPDPVTVGGTLTYTVSINNAGPATATAITMTDTLPAGVTFVGAAGAGWNCSQATGLITCTQPTLAVGSAPAIVITVTAPTTAGVITNTASVISSVADPTTPNTASVTTTVNPPPSVRFSSAAYSVNENGGTATITATLSVASGSAVTVNYASSNGTAMAGSDYVTATGVLTFAPGQTSQTFNVSITNDALEEPNETVTLTLSSPVNATLGSPNPATLTIVDNDGQPTVQFSAANYSVNENVRSAATITATLSTASGSTVTVNYATSNGTASAGSDYTAASGVLTFAPGQTSRTFNVNILNDSLDEPNETVTLTLSNPVNATLGSLNPATLTIVDNDGQSINDVSGSGPASSMIYLPLILRN